MLESNTFLETIPAFDQHFLSSGRNDILTVNSQSSRAVPALTHYILRNMVATHELIYFWIDRHATNALHLFYILETDL